VISERCEILGVIIECLDASLPENDSRAVHRCN
jgi:hypothetical protein